MPKIFKDKDNNVLYTGYETSEVVANPTLAGTEANLTGLQVGETKYAVPQGGGSSNHLYVHSLSFNVGATNSVWLQLSLITTFSDLITDVDLQRGEELPDESANPKWLLRKYRFISAYGYYYVDNSNKYAVTGISSESSSTFNILYITINNSSSGIDSYEADCSDIHTVVDNVRELI